MLSGLRRKCPIALLDLDVVKNRDREKETESVWVCVRWKGKRDFFFWKAKIYFGRSAPAPLPSIGPIRPIRPNPIWGRQRRRTDSLWTIFSYSFFIFHRASPLSPVHTRQELGAHYILASALSLGQNTRYNQFVYLMAGSSSHWATCSFTITLPHSPLSSYGSTLDRNKERPWTSVCSEMFPAFLFCSMDQWIGESPDYSLSFRFFGCTSN